MKKNIAVIGSSGAIGNAISKILQEDKSVNSIYNFQDRLARTFQKKKIAFI